MWPTCVVCPDSPLRVAVGDPDQPIGLGERQRPQEQRVDDAEDGGAGADAEPGDEDGERREAGVAPQRADGVAQILKEVVEGHARLDGWTVPFVYGTGRRVSRGFVWLGVRDDFRNWLSVKLRKEPVLRIARFECDGVIEREQPDGRRPSRLLIEAGMLRRREEG